MNLRKITAKKPLKLLVILLSWMIIATASAALYYSLSMKPVATISEPAVIFVQGANWPGGGWGTNGTWCTISLKAYPNVTLTYDEPLNLSETSGSDRTFHLTSQSITPASGWSAANWTFINFTIMDETGSAVAGGSFDYYTTGSGAGTTWQEPSMNDITLPADTMYTIKIETKAAEGAWLNEVCTIVITVDVTE